MTYSGIKKGTFYPMGGFGKVIDAFKEICSEQGVEFHTNEAVQSVNIEEKTIQSIVTDKRTFETDIVVGSADYNHVDSKLLPPKYRNYNDSYWQKTFSPSLVCLCW